MYSIEGFIATDMIADVNIDAMDGRIPLERIGGPDEVANMIYFLATKASYVTGEDVTVSGGLEFRL